LVAHQEYTKNSSAKSFLVAFLRCADMSMRATALGGLLRLHGQGSEHDRTQYDPKRIFAAASNNWPDIVVDALMDYGMMRGDTYTMIKIAGEFQNSMMSVVQTHDFYALGKKLVFHRRAYLCRDSLVSFTGQLHINDGVLHLRRNV
jgi:hypothetical protein